MKTIRIAIIGKRPFGLYGTRATTEEERAAYAPLVARMTQALSSLLEGYESAEVLTGCAAGAEQLGFWAAYAMRRDQGADVTIRLILPYPGYVDEASACCLFDRDMRRKIEYLADGVESVGDRCGGDALSAAETERVRRCDVLLAVCQPTDAFAPSDLGRTMRMASAAGKRVVLVTP